MKEASQQFCRIKKRIHFPTLVPYSSAVMSWRPMYSPAMDINGFRYEHRALFQLGFDEEDVFKWRSLVRGLPVPGGSYYPELTTRLTELSEDSITIERARIILGPHRTREGGITTMVDLFDALTA